MRWIATPEKDTATATLEKRLWSATDELPANSGLTAAHSRAHICDAIEQDLYEGLPRAYTPDVFKIKAGVVFQHVYERYGRAA